MNELIRTLTVICEDRPGLMTDLTELLAKNNILLHDFSGDVVDTTAVFKFIPADYEAAFKILETAGYHLIAHRNLLVCMEDKPGALARLSRRLSDAELVTRGLHIVGQRDNCTLVAVEVGDPEQARVVLADILV